MSGGPNLFGEDPADDSKFAYLNRDAARDAANEAIDRVNANADEEWKAAAKRIVREVARANREFPTDAVWGAGLPKPREPRAMGAVMRWAQSHGLVKNTGRIVKTAQVSRHNAPVTVWESLIYESDSTVGV